MEFDCIGLGRYASVPEAVSAESERVGDHESRSELGGCKDA